MNQRNPVGAVMDFVYFLWGLAVLTSPWLFAYSLAIAIVTSFRRSVPLWIKIAMWLSVAAASVTSFAMASTYLHWRTFKP